MKKETLYYKKDNLTMGEISFIIDNNIMIIDHTEVYSNYQGQGIAKKLIELAIDYAKNNNLLIKATCSYAINYFSKNKSDLYIG